MFDVKGWIIYAIYIAIHLVKTTIEMIMLKARKNFDEEIIYYRRITRREKITSIRPKKNEV